MKICEVVDDILVKFIAASFDYPIGIASHTSPVLESVEAL
jgi:hypothetical protein